MKFLLMIYGDESAWARLSPGETAAVYAAHADFGQALAAAGALLGGAELQPSDGARTVRFGPAGAIVTDGPFAEAREQLGGYYLIDVPDLQAALEWARRMPGMADGAVEVRAVSAMD